MRTDKQKKNWEDTRNSLLDAFEKLSPGEQKLLQVCAIIDEDVYPSNIMGILTEAGLTNQKGLNSTNELQTSLRRLASQKLLNSKNRVPAEIRDVMFRRAVDSGLLHRAPGFLAGINSPENWQEDGKNKIRCVSCRAAVQDKAFRSREGFLCTACVLSELKISSRGNHADPLPEGEIIAALSGDNDLTGRLIAIWKLPAYLLSRDPYNFENKYDDAERLSEDHRKILSLLVENMGFVHFHPLAYSIREAALRSCALLGRPVLPFLLGADRRRSSKLRANITRAAGIIAPEDAAVRDLLTEGASDPDTDVRYSVAFIANRLFSPWAAKTLDKLAGDTDPKIRELVKTAFVSQKTGQPSYYRYNQMQQAIPPETAIRPSLRFGPLIRAIQKALPAPSLTYHLSHKECCRLSRDLRIAVHGHDVFLFHDSLSSLDTRCSEITSLPDALNDIFNNPFDEVWFRTLPAYIGQYALANIFLMAATWFGTDTAALSYAMNNKLWKSSSYGQGGLFLYYLCVRLILGGKIHEALEVINGSESHFMIGLLGMLRFVEGKNDEALKAFNDDFRSLRTRTRKRNTNFIGIEGIFYILALLKSRDAASLKRANQLLDSSLNDDPDFRLPALRALKGVAYLQNLDMEGARRTIANEQWSVNDIVALVKAIAIFWINGKLSPEMIASVEAIYQMSRAISLDWVAMEAAALLIRAGGGTQEKNDFIRQVSEQSGMQPFTPTIEIEEDWQKNLRALIELGKSPGTAAPRKKTGDETRLIWLVDVINGTVFLQAIEQKQKSEGVWSKGRQVAMSRLFKRVNLEFASPQDLALCAAIRSERHYYGREDYHFDYSVLLPSLVGHPLLFLMKSPAERVEFVKGEPEIMVAQKGSRLQIKPVTRFGDSDVILLQETATRFKVIKLTEEQRRIARILGEEGIDVPVSARQDVQAAIATISSFALVHSDIGGTTAEVMEVTADPTPHIRLLPSGPGLRAEVFVMPFKEKGSPALLPGAGLANIMAEVAGKRLQTSRDIPAEKRLANSLEKASPTFARMCGPDRKAYLEDPEDCLQILLDLKNLHDAGQVIVEWPEGERLKVTREFSSSNLNLKIGGKNDWFELSGSLRVDEKLTLDIKQLLEMLHTTKKRFIPLADGEFLSLTDEFRKRLDELDLYTEKQGKGLRLHPLAALSIQDIQEAIPDIVVDKAWKERMERIRAVQKLVPVVPSTLRAELRDYQVDGYTWLSRLAEMEIGACLADDMGLGKTMQTLALIVARASRGPSLVVAPTSVCWNWCAEAARFAPTLNARQLTGTNREELVRGLGNHDLLVASYGLLVQEEDLLSSVDWNMVVLDEAQSIKNVLTKRFQSAMKLKGGFRMVTTGTPIQNHLDELWALFSFINPGLLGTQQHFNTRFAIPIEKYNDREARSRLKKLIQPFILRRLKSQVLDELPPRTEIVLQVEMNPEEAAFYEALRQRALEKIEADSAPIYMKQLKILAEITRLRQAACNPRLVIPDSTLASSKLTLFGEIVEELRENRHKALVFSQFVRHLDLLREYLDGRKIGYRYLDGSTSPKDRQREVDMFQAGEGDLFLISLKAGGLGLNLTAADYVIHMDPWWNPSVEDQASDRAHRIGQEQPVTVYRLVTKDTIEEKIVKLHQEKRSLAGSLLDGTDISGKISAEELIRLIQER